MSGNSAAATPSVADPRSRRTHEALGGALVRLMQEQPFDSITIQHVLDRAGVARSTFYAHFTDKDDLFVSNVEHFLSSASSMLTRSHAPAERLAPVKELFAHVGEVRPFYRALIESGKVADVRELGVGFFSRSIEQRLAAAGVDLPAAELRATAYALAGAMFAQLEWWVRHGEALSPAEMDELFHRIAWRGLPIPGTAANTWPKVPTPIDKVVKS